MTKKKWFLPALIGGILLVPVLWFTLVYLTMPGYAGHFDVVESNWGVTLPWDAGWQEVYGDNRRGGFHGDGLSYFVYTCEDGGEMDALFDWETTQTPHAACQRWLDELDVPAVMRPPYTECGMKRMTKAGGDEILFWWHSDTKTLYIAESYQ